MERAKVVLAALAALAALVGEGVGAIAVRFQLSPATVYLWLPRFETQGLAGLADKPRGGRPPTYTREQVGTLMATALSDPQRLGQAYSSWTLDRLAAYLAEQEGIALKRSRRDELLLAEGLRGRKEESWVGERVDPAFAENRGRSSGSTRRRRRGA
ncbi:MAG TPA: helix-turn-helix domain-containing protein [Ktedonobacterales bacterium]|nr:helix-turn-helix domain-containing protein [Ktedonobacterales bacterium]